MIAVIGAPGEDYSSLISGGSAPAKTEASPAPVAQVTETAPAAESIDTSNINAKLVTMPLLSDTMTEGVVHKWLKK